MTPHTACLLWIGASLLAPAAVLAWISWRASHQIEAG
jgi:hypothetical protein